MKTHDITDKMVCEAVAEYQSDIYNKPFPYEIIAQKTGCAEKVAYRAMERAVDSDYLDYGVSLRTAWLTEKGKEVLKENSATATIHGRL